MNIRAQWPFWLIAGFTLLSAQTPLFASGTGCHGGGGGFNRFAFGGPNDPGAIPATSVYNWQINNATGTAGPTPPPPPAPQIISGWSIIQVVPNGSGTRRGDYYWDASPTDKLTFSLQTLVNPTTVGNDVQGPMANFNPNQAYSWSVVTFTGGYLTQNTAAYPNGPPMGMTTLDADTNFDFTNFVNSNLGPSAFTWNLQLYATGGGELDLNYSPVPAPEPGTLALTAIGLLGVWRWRHAAAKLSCPLPPFG